MASTYSTNLGIELIGSGEQSGTWGTTTNNNLGTLLEQAISGVTTTACTGGTDTITIPNGASGTARNMFLELTGTGGGSLVVPANKKLYFIYNNTSLAITVKVTGQTGVSVPAAAKTILVMNSAGTDVVNATNYFSALTLGAALPVASGGTGFTSTTAYSVYTGNSAGTGFTAIANGTTGQILQATTSGAPVWGSTYAGTVTSVAALTLGTTGTDLSSTVATGTTTPVITLQVPTASAANRGALSSTDWSTFNGKQAALVSGTNIKTVNSTTLLGSGDVSVGVTSVTGTAPVVSSGGATPAISMPVATSLANGYLSSTDWTTFNNKGSGSVTSVAQSFTGGLISVAGSPITTSGTLALTVAGTSGGIPYFSSASTWATSAALAANALVIGGGAGVAPATTTTGTGVVTALGVNTGTAGAFVVNGGALGTPSSGTLTNCTFPTLNQNTTGSSASCTGNAAGLSSTLVVASGGTGATTATAYAVQCGGTTSTGAHQSVASVGTAGQVLTSNGAGALPTFQAAAGGQLSYALYTTAGTATWTCPTGVTKVFVIVIGGGGGATGGDAAGAGGLAIGSYTVTPGTGYSYTVGAGGAGSWAGIGAVGGTSSFSSFCSATGGQSYPTVGGTGVGSSGTFSNTSLRESTHIFVGGVSSGQTTATWTAASGINPGAGGAGWPFSSSGYSGVNGAVYIQYVG